MDRLLYIGAMTKATNIKRLANIAQKKGIPVFRMKLAANEYRMEPQRVV
jgi:hypothetical protein